MSSVRRENSKLGLVAAFVVAGVLCLGLTGATRADAASKPKVSASFGVAGSQVKVSGTVSKGAPSKAPARRKWKAALEQQVGKRWVKRKTGKLSKGKKGSSKYKLAWKAPSSLKSGKFRVRVFAGKRTISSSKVKKLTFSSQVPAPKVSEVVPSSVQKLPTQDDMTLVVSGNRSYRAGEYLAAAPGGGAPDGFLLEVVSSTSSGGQTSVNVKPGSLYDAVPNGQLSLSTGDLQAATPQNRDAKKLLRALDASGASNYANVPFSKPVTCTGSGSMTLDGNFDASLAPNFDLKWSKRLGIPTGIDSARATVDASISADASAELSAAASCTLAPITLLAPRFTFIVVVGPVPVPVAVSLPIVLEASASVSGSVTISADASVQGSLGLDYRDGDVSAVKEFSSDANLNHDVEAQADAEALIGPDIEVEAGWKIPVIGGVAAEVEINARTGLRLEYVVGNSPPGKLCVPLELGGEVEFDTPLGDIEKGLPEYSTDIKCVEFGESEFHIEGTIDLTYDYSNSRIGTNGFTSWNVEEDSHTTAKWIIDSEIKTGEGWDDVDHTANWEMVSLTVDDGGCPEGGGTAHIVGSGTGTVTGGYRPVISKRPGEYRFDLGLPTGSLTYSGSLCGSPYAFVVSMANPPGESDFRSIPNRMNDPWGPLVFETYSGNGLLVGQETVVKEYPPTQSNYSTEGTVKWNLSVLCPSGQPPSANWTC